MQPDPQRSFRPSSVARGTRSWLAVAVLIAVCILVEALLAAADSGWIGTVRWRGLAYQNGAFWAGLLENWRPNYAAQPWTMFLSYAFLHAGVSHLLGNMLTLLALGPYLCRRIGPGGFLAVYVLSAIGGAAGFALLGNTAQPVVGASGALFGLAGALIYADWAARRRMGARGWPVLGTVLFLIALNLVFWVALDGVMAWEAHLGGFVAGWIVAVVLSWWSCTNRQRL